MMSSLQSISLFAVLVALCDCRQHAHSRQREYQPSVEDFDRDQKFIQEKMGYPDREWSEVPDRVSNITQAQFDAYFQAGRPLIVTDMIQDWGMKDWNCDSVAEDFAEETVMVWSYQEGSRMQKHYKLKDVQKWQKAKMKQETDPRFDKDAPKLLSFHWYPVQMGYEGDEEADRLGDGDDYHSTLASAKARKKIKAAYKMPYFIEKNPMNLEFTKERIEFFLGMPGAGAALHADGVCEAIFSVQLSGTKQWRLSPLPPYERAVQRPSKQNQGPGRKWLPTYTFTLQPGEAIFFPPSFMHETKNDGDDCALSASLQIRYPFPVGHIRDFSKRLLNSQEVSFCFEHWAPFVTGHKDGVREMYRQIYRGRQQELVIGAFFDEIDTDSDGEASVEEKAEHFESIIQEHRGAVEFMAKQEAKDWFVFNDVNKDGKVTRDEYLALHDDIQNNYRTAIDQGACDEDGCHADVRKNVLAGKLNGIESAYLNQNVYGDKQQYSDEEDDL